MPEHPGAPASLALVDLPEVSDLLLLHQRVRLRIASRSMAPTLRPGDEIVVEPVSIEALLTGDLILFEHTGQLICHRLVEVSGHPCTLLARGDAATGPAQRIGRDQVLGKVVSIRKRTPWVALCEALRSALLPSLLRWLPRLQQLRLYRVLIRPIVTPFLSYHLGLAHGARWYEWQELRKDNGFPALPPSARPHVLMLKLGKDVVGSSVLIFKNSGWQCEDVYLRMRYRGLGLESDFHRLAQRLGSNIQNAQSYSATHSRVPQPTF